MLHGDDSKMQNLKKQCLDLSNRDIKLAINNNNARPLLQSIYHQIIAENNNNNNKQQSELNEDGIFTSFTYTSRTSFIAHSLVKGKVIILIDGMPIALIFPSSFHNFVPTINISTPEYNPQPQLPRIEINPKSNVYIPYEPGYKSVPKTKNKTHPIYNLDWMYTTTYSPGFCNI